MDFSVSSTEMNKLCKAADGNQHDTADVISIIVFVMFYSNEVELKSADIQITA